MFSSTTKDSASATVIDAKNTLYNAKRDLRDASDTATNEFASVARSAGRQVRSFVDTAGEQLTEASEKVASEIRTNPVRSSALALGIGFIIGAILRR